MQNCVVVFLTVICVFLLLERWGQFHPFASFACSKFQKVCSEKEVSPYLTGTLPTALPRPRAIQTSGQSNKTSGRTSVQEAVNRGLNTLFAGHLKCF